MADARVRLAEVEGQTVMVAINGHSVVDMDPAEVAAFLSLVAEGEIDIDMGFAD